MKKIRVLHVIGKMDRAGAETMIMNLYRNMDRNAVQFDFAVHTKDTGAYDTEIKNLGGNIYYFPKFNGINLIRYIYCWFCFFKAHHEINIVHGHIGSSAFIYLFIAKLFKCKTVVHSHSAFSNVPTLHDRIISWLNYFNPKFVDLVLAASRQAGIDRFGKKILKSSKFHVLNNAIDVQNFVFNESVRNVTRNELKIEDDTLLLGNVGRLVEAKNQKKLYKFLINCIKKM